VAVDKIRFAVHKMQSKGGFSKEGYVVYLFTCDLYNNQLSVGHTI
jgi:hypothetical protein